MNQPVINCPNEPNDTGAFQISWSFAEPTNFRLTETDLSSQTTKILYEGNQTASTVTGRPEGKYSYQVETLSVNTSSPSCVVTVQYPSITLTILLFSIGFLISISTVILVIKGHRAHRRGEIG